MKKIIISIIASVFLVTNASAVDLSNLSIGVSANTAVYAATGTERNSNEDASATTITSEYGAFNDDFASIFIEMGNDQISVGLDYVPDSLETPENINTQEGGDNKVSAEFENLMTLYVKMNLPLGGTYVKLGYSSVDVITKESMVSTNNYGDTSTDGPTFGIGYQIENADGISLRAEITGSQFDDVSVNNGIAATANRNVIEVSDMIGARGTISLVKSF